MRESQARVAVLLEKTYVLYLLVVDGRRPGSVGATEVETALLLLSLGAESGLLMDGGAIPAGGPAASPEKP